MRNKELIAKVLELWNLFRASSSNPLSSLEQITYLIALKRAEAVGRGSAGKSVSKSKTVSKAYPHWSELIKRKSQQDKFIWFLNKGFPYLKSLKSFGNPFHLSMVDASFGIREPKILDHAVNLINELPVADEDVDGQGDIYEDLLALVSFGGKHGQFLTPRHIIRTIVELCDPQLGETICDPAAGAAGFLVAANQWILKTHTSQAKLHIEPDGSWHNLDGDLLPKNGKGKALDAKNFVGYDFDTTMVRLGIMNMMLHGISQPEYYHQDSLSGERLKPRQFDLVMCYPPFGGVVDKKLLNKKLLSPQTNKTELLFVELSLGLLKAKGRCAVIVPESVAINTDIKSRTLREQIIDNHKLEAVVSLPRGCFLPYTASKTAILLIKKEDVTDQVWLYEVTGDGYTLDEKRKLDPKNNDLTLVPQAYRALVRGDGEAWESTATKDLAMQRSVLITKNEIKANGLSFSIGLYRKLKSVAEKQEDPQQIIARVHTLQRQIGIKLKQIQTMIQEVTGA